MSQSPTQKPLKRLIKEKIRDLLKGKTVVRDNVSISQSLPTQEEEVPKILIYASIEAATLHDTAPKDYKRVMSLSVEVVMTGDDDDELDHDLEIIGDQVERLLEADTTLGDLVNGVDYTGCVYATSEEGSVFMASLVLNFDVTYYEYAIRKNSQCYPDLLTAGAEWEVGPEKETKAEDEYTFPQET